MINILSFEMVIYRNCLLVVLIHNLIIIVDQNVSVLFCARNMDLTGKLQKLLLLYIYTPKTVMQVTQPYVALNYGK